MILIISFYSCTESSDLLIKGQNIEIQFDKQLHSKVISTFDSQELQFGNFSPSEYVVVDSMEVKDFLFAEKKSEQIMDDIGQATSVKKNLASKNQLLTVKHDLMLSEEYMTNAAKKQGLSLPTKNQLRYP